MADDDDSQIVTEFLVGTYRLQPTLHDVRAVLESAGVANHRAKDEPEAASIPLITGSSAELYIKPMLPCVDDIDIMNHRSTKLAIPAGYPAPTRLPNEFHSRVAVYEIVDSEYPGYVYLRARYVLTENIDNGRYNAVIEDYWPWIFKSSTRPTDADTSIHGPANTILTGVGELAVDRVDCMRCLYWPLQAADWPTRHRNEGWPDSATVDRVVNNGCDIVLAAHRLCRHDPRESMFQHRLSFSRAEIVLLNSWRPVKQIVYHMLRIFMKTERLTDVTDNTGTKIISNYHIKTLMLWACEKKPRNWWLKDRNAVIICVELLRTLTVCLTDSHCAHYFISNCNLMDTVVDQGRITSRLTSVTESWLSTWFVKNYIMKCAQRCHVERLFNDVGMSVKLRIAALSVVFWRQSAEFRDMLEVCNHAEYLVLAQAFRWSERIHSYVYFVKTITKLDVLHANYLTAVALLHIAIKFTNHDVDIELMDVLSTLCGQSVGKRRYSSQRNSVMLLSQAVKLMKVVENNSRSTVQLLEIELSKAYLYRALRCKDSDNDSIYCLANVYLAVLYYTTGQYQTAIDHCTLVVRSQDHSQSQCSSHVVQGELLPKINAGVHNVLGLAVFYQHVRTAALNHKRSQHVIVFSTKLFAHYMLMSCLSATKCHQLARTVSMNEVQHCYWKDVGDIQQLFIDDLLLFKSLSISSTFRHYQHHRQRPTIKPTSLNTTKLVELLQQFAVEHLTTFRQFQARDFSFVWYHVTTDFEAMYAYKRGDYRLCLQLSTQNVLTLLNPTRPDAIYTFPEFIQLLDGDIVSLTALTLIVNPECRQQSSLNVGISQLTLSLYLTTLCQLKLRHSATQLAQILDYIQVAHRRHTADDVLDHLTLKLTKRKIILHLRHNFE